MPYIKQKDREKWIPIIDKITKELSDTDPQAREGVLNYLFSSILKKNYTPSYSEYNKAIGLLECIKQEFYRKTVSPYEEIKEEENGSI